MAFLTPRETLAQGFGELPAGTFQLERPVLVDAGQILRGHPLGTRLVALFDDRPAIEISAGGISNLEVCGGLIGVNVRNGARRTLVERVWIRQVGKVGLWVGQAYETRVRDLVVEEAPDNGVQLEAPHDCEIRSAVLLGPFGNKALDCTHRTGGGPFRVQLRHLTVLDPHGYGIGLDGWRADGDHVLANSLILEKPTGPGASGYAVRCSGGPDAGRFIRNLANPQVLEGAQARERTFPGLDLTEDQELSLLAQPAQLVGLFPADFSISIGDAAPGERWGALKKLVPIERTQLWRGSLFWTTRADILGRRRRLARMAVAAGALG